MSLSILPLKDPLKSTPDGAWLGFFLEIFRLFNGKSYNTQNLDNITFTGITGSYTASGKLVYDRSFCWLEIKIIPSGPIDGTYIAADLPLLKLPQQLVGVTGLTGSFTTSFIGSLNESGHLATFSAFAGISTPVTITGQFLNSFKV